MGLTGSKTKDSASSNSGSSGARKHPLLENGDYAKIRARHGELTKLTQVLVTVASVQTVPEAAPAPPPIAPGVSSERESSSDANDSSNNSASKELKQHKSFKAGEVCSKKLAAVLGVAEDDATTLARVFRQNGNTESSISTEIFIDVVANLVRGSTSDIRRAIFAGALGPNSEGSGASTVTTPELFGQLLQLLFHAAGNPGSFESAAMVTGFQVFAEKQAKIDGAEKVNLNFGMFNRWCSAQSPSLQEGLHKLFNEKILCAEKHGKAAGNISQSALTQSEIVRPCDAFALACGDSRASSRWDLLFSSNKQGMSFDMLAKALLGYPGPTLVVIQDAEGSVFGGLVSETWQELPQFYGKSSSVLTSLRPTFRTICARTDGSSPGTNHFQFLRCRGKSGIHGLGFGGDENNPRLWLDRNFENCRAADFDLTYEQGYLRPANPDGTSGFKPFIIEAWGFGGDDAAAAQAIETATVDQMRMDRRKVDRKKFAENSFDREMLLGKTFGHQQQIENRGGR